MLGCLGTDWNAKYHIQDHKKHYEEVRFISPGRARYNWKTYKMFNIIVIFSGVPPTCCLKTLGFGLYGFVEKHQLNTNVFGMILSMFF